MPLWLIAIKTKLAGWIAALAALLGVAGLIYVKGRSDAREREAERKAAEALDASTAARQRAENHTTVVRDVASGVQTLPSASSPYSITPEEAAQAVTTPNPPKLSEANPNSAAGRLAALTRKGLVLVPVLLLAGCSLFQPKAAPPAYEQLTCAVWSPIIPSLDDSLTDGTATQILTHNCVGYRLGCWKSEGMKEACAF